MNYTVLLGEFSMPPTYGEIPKDAKCIVNKITGHKLFFNKEEALIYGENSLIDHEGYIVLELMKMNVFNPDGSKFIFAVESKEMKTNEELRRNVLQAIQLLQGIDGETFDYVIDSLEFREYIEIPVSE